MDETGVTEYDVTAYYKPKFDQFVCLDPDGKIGFPIELCESNEDITPLAQAFIQNYGRKPYTHGKYVLNSEYPSRYQTGCMFDNEYINFLFKTFINDFKHFEIMDRTTGYCILDKLEIAFIYEGGTQPSAYDWKDVNDIDWNQTFNFHQFFRPATQEEIDMINKDKDVIIDEKKSKKTSQNNTKKSNSSKSNSTK